MQRLEKFLFYFLVFCLPWQTRIIIFQWGDAFNEWSSAFFYFTDFLLIALLLLWFWRLGLKQIFKIKFSVLSLLLAIALLSIFKAVNWQLGLYIWLKLLQFILLYAYLKANFAKLIKPRYLAWIFVISGLSQSLVAIFQHIRLQSLGLKYLGESTLGPFIAGVAKFVVDGNIIVRAYGTLPHPNLLAAFLLVAIFCLYFLYLSRKSYSMYWNLFYGLLFFGLLLGLWFTFSRVIIIAFFVFSIIYFVFLFKKYQPQIKFLILIFFLLSAILTYATWPLVANRSSVSLDDQAVSLRLQYNQTAFEYMTAHPGLGVGLGNFVSQSKEAYPNLEEWQYQPVHNIYLLIASEIGIFGFVVFIYFLYLQFKKRSKSLFSRTFLFLFLSLLFIGLFDHFLLTLQQGSLIFWLVLGILASCCLEKEKPRL